jgi:DNA helicase HerA-like ATPase
VEREGGDQFFGEPALDIADLMRTTADGIGTVNILAADQLIQKPRLYSVFLLWLLSELFEELPEVGDLERPKLVLFFDEAHLLFENAPKPLLEKIEQVVRLIRSKGVGVYFITQNPTDLPDDVLGQLGNRVQHALRAFTAKDQKAVKAAAETFRANPNFATGEAIVALGVGEALVSTLEAGGSPGVVQRTLIRPPASRVGPLQPPERRAVLAASPLAGRYDEAIDRQSAYEQLNAKAEMAAKAAAQQEAAAQGRTARGTASPAPRSRGGRTPDTLTETLAKQAIRTVSSQVGRELVRGLLGSLFRGR